MVKPKLAMSCVRGQTIVHTCILTTLPKRGSGKSTAPQNTISRSGAVRSCRISCSKMLCLSPLQIASLTNNFGRYLFLILSLKTISYTV